MPSTSPKTTFLQLRLLYPLWMAVGIFSLLYVPGQLIDYSDAVATARQINEKELLFRLAIVGRLLTQLFGIFIPLLLFRSLKAVSEWQAVFMLVFALIGVPISMYHETHMLAVLEALQEPERVLSLIGAHNTGHTISFIFWGLWLVPLGTLVYRSGFLPKLIGVLLWLAGLGYFVGALVRVVQPDARQLLQILEYLTFGEVAFILWLVIVGPRFRKPVSAEDRQVF